MTIAERKQKLVNRIMDRLSATYAPQSVVNIRMRQKLNKQSWSFLSDLEVLTLTSCKRPI